MPFQNILGLWALLTLIPLIILYLRRPKPTEKMFPSLMFLVKDPGAIKRYSFFKNLLRDLLLLLQILILVALSLSIAEPYLPKTGLVLGQHNIIVIDASASSQTMENGVTRFEKSIEEAKKYVSGKTSIVLAGTNPEVVLENGGKGAAMDVLNTIKPKDTTTNLEAAMRVAETIAKKGKIIVISDFKQTEGQDPLIIKRILVSKGLQVELVDVGGKAKNIGIINLAINKYQTKVYVKNFNEQEESVKVELMKDNPIDSLTKTIKANSIETFTFATVSGASKIKLDVKDDFELDNVVYIASPEKMKIKVLLVTNPKYETESQTYLKHALEASPEVELETAEPPIIRSLQGNDVIIIGGVFSDMLLPSFFKDVGTAVSNGSSFVITSYDNLGNIAFMGLLPVSITGVKEEDSRILVNIVNRFTKDVDFSLVKVSKYYTTNADNFTAVVASVSSNPVIAVKEKGKGKIVFIGIMDKYSDFKLSPDYPIFWNNLLNFLIGAERIEDYNLKLEEKPTLSKAGYYIEQNKKIAVNLLNEKESDISKEKSISETEGEMQFEEEQEEAKLNLILPLLIAAFLLVFLELLYIKTRGDL